MRKHFGTLRMVFIAALLAGAAPGIAAGEHLSDKNKERPRKFYEYKGNYRADLDALKAKFTEAFGYELLDLDRGWRPEEIRRMHSAFEQLPPQFHRIPGLKGFYRLGKFPGQTREVEGGRIPAATYPRFNTIYLHDLKKYRVHIQDDTFRLEFYDPLFSEDEETLVNIVHHEMAHAFDLAHGFMSFSNEWLALADFRILNLPPLDARPGTDFLFALVNNPSNPNYAPVSNRHLATYSRENPQEDFANSVAAYIHYPYFQYSHPARYRYLKTHVFEGREFFPKDPRHSGYLEKIQADAQDALKKGDAVQLFKMAVEVGRNHHPEAERALVSVIQQALRTDTGGEGPYHLATATCYLYVPEALKVRQDLVRQKRVDPDKILKHERCLRMGWHVFDQDQVHWPVLNMYFYLENKQAVGQFLDPVALTTLSRGYNNRYYWKLSYGDEGGAVIAKGFQEGATPVTGSVRLDLTGTASRELNYPTGILLKLEVTAERYNLKTGRRYQSTPSLIQFVVHPWFEYLGPVPPNIEVRYPLSWKRPGKEAVR